MTRAILATLLMAACAIGADEALPFPADGKFRKSALAGVEEAYLARAFPSSHASNLLELRNGDLLCVWFSGTWEGNSDVAIVVSCLKKGSSQWTKPLVVDHQEGVSFQNPVLFEAPDGTLWIFHTTQGAGAGESNARVLVTKSKDGEHWSAPQVLFDTPGAFTREPLVTMPHGEWLLPIYIAAGKNSSLIKISADKGAHWRDCPVPDSDGLVQPDVVRAGNEYLAFFRSRAADFIYKSTSPDGCAWTAPKKTELPNNNASIQVTKLRNGHLALAFDNSGRVIADGKPKAGPRKPLSVALSKDNGATWGWVRDLELGRSTPEPSKDPNRKEPGREEYSYPSVTQTSDGKITVAFTYQRYTIKVMRFDEQWIEHGETAGTYKPSRR